MPGRPHTATKWRWALRGVKGVKLETVMIGAIRFTSEEAIARFLAKLNGEAQPPPPRRAAEEAGRELVAKGA